MATPSTRSDSEPGNGADADRRRREHERDPSDTPWSKTVSLVRRAQTGDKAALNDLCARYYDQVVARVRQRLGDHLRDFVASADIVQETFVHAVRCFDRFEMRDEHALTNWLAQIAENAIRGVNKAAPRRKLEPLGSDSMPATGPTVTSVVDTALGVESVKRALQTLPERARQLIELRLFEKLSWKDVAARTGRASEDAARMAYRDAFCALEAECRRLAARPEPH